MKLSLRRWEEYGEGDPPHPKPPHYLNIGIAVQHSSAEFINVLWLKMLLSVSIIGRALNEYLNSSWIENLTHIVICVPYILFYIFVIVNVLTTEYLAIKNLFAPFLRIHI